MPHERGPIACAPSEFSYHSARRSQNPLLLLARQPSTQCPTRSKATCWHSSTWPPLATRRRSAWLRLGLRTPACHPACSKKTRRPAPLHSF